jgi:hypothetical protein
MAVLQDSIEWLWKQESLNGVTVRWHTMSGTNALQKTITLRNQHPSTFGWFSGLLYGGSK